MVVLGETVPFRRTSITVIKTPYLAFLWIRRQKVILSSWFCIRKCGTDTKWIFCDWKENINDEICRGMDETSKKLYTE